ncbi:MAG: DUF4111 domain-containing protein, partial [Chloroflexi bacterium]|nr:DUF4111 domain-containing protein [Chloroflexota bacterium]
DFDYETSDIDFVAATAVSPSPQQFAELVEMHGRIGKTNSKWAIELEGAYIPLPALRRYDPANATHLYIDRGASNLRWEHLDVDWVIHRYVLYKQGIALAGPPCHTLIDPVSTADLQQATLELLDFWWVPMIENPVKLQHDGYRTYAIMTMCRMLYTFKMGDVVSKPAAAHWMLTTQDGRWHSMVETGLIWHGDEQKASVTEVQAFIAYTKASARRKYA